MKNDDAEEGDKNSAGQRKFSTDACLKESDDRNVGTGKYFNNSFYDRGKK